MPRAVCPAIAVLGVRASGSRVNITIRIHAVVGSLARPRHYCPKLGEDGGGLIAAPQPQQRYVNLVVNEREQLVQQDVGQLVPLEGCCFGRGQFDVERSH
jgi:hypothetical protein